MFNIKAAGKSIMTNGKEVLLIGGGAMLSKKFLDTEVVFAQQDPNGALRKYGPGLKAVIALAATGMVKNKMVQSLLLGVALEGGITQFRKMGASSYLQPIGANENFDGMGNTVAREYITSVAGDDYLNELLEGPDFDLSGGELTPNAASSVAGFGSMGENMNPWA